MSSSALPAPKPFARMNLNWLAVLNNWDGWRRPGDIATGWF